MVSVISHVDTGHDDMIHDAQMDYYGTRLATCSSDRSVKIFEVKGAKQTLLADLREHEGPVWQVAWAHPMYGTILASCSYDRKVIIWQEDGHTWRKIHEYANHDSSVNSVCWAPHEHGLVLACASSDGTVSVLTYTSVHTWEAKKITNAHTIGCNAVSWAPAVASGSADGTARTGAVQRLVTGGCDTYVKIWRLDSASGNWVEETRLEGHSNWVRDVAWAPSIGLPRSIIASCSQDRRVIIWTSDAATGQWQPQELHTFDDVIWHLSWSVTGNILAVSGGDNKVSLWKESLEGHWVCLSDSAKSQGGNEQRTL
ncbi:nuclear pore and COPII coat complex component secretory 13 [Oratosquilla oratoria]|uniref:nuclear pore and COPII coat complex component secretory 13 n=1 Tax=Oratosquilla oratoria TaxID=337810 RepID=UPI003F770DEF